MKTKINNCTGTGTGTYTCTCTWLGFYSACTFRDSIA